jgi:hypothetical protein
MGLFAREIARPITLTMKKKKNCDKMLLRLMRASTRDTRDVLVSHKYATEYK